MMMTTNPIFGDRPTGSAQAPINPLVAPKQGPRAASAPGTHPLPVSPTAGAGEAQHQHKGSRLNPQAAAAAMLLSAGHTNTTAAGLMTAHMGAAYHGAPAPNSGGGNGVIAAAAGGGGGFVLGGAGGIGAGAPGPHGIGIAVPGSPGGASFGSAGRRGAVDAAAEMVLAAVAGGSPGGSVGSPRLLGSPAGTVHGAAALGGPGGALALPMPGSPRDIAGGMGAGAGAAFGGYNGASSPPGRAGRMQLLTTVIEAVRLATRTPPLHTRCPRAALAFPMHARTPQLSYCPCLGPVPCPSACWVCCRTAPCPALRMYCPRTAARTARTACTDERVLAVLRAVVHVGPDVASLCGGQPRRAVAAVPAGEGR
jgi:hypothetical protein